jgi:hypothetical protein
MRGVPRVAALVLKIYLLSLLRRPRGGAVLARAAVRLFCTQKSARRVHVMWAWAPMPEVGPSVEAEGGTTVRRLHAPCAAVRLLNRWLRRRWKSI